MANVEDKFKNVPRFCKDDLNDDICLKPESDHDWYYTFHPGCEIFVLFKDYKKLRDYTKELEDRLENIKKLFGF